MNEKVVVYHGIQNAKYAKKAAGGTYATPVPMKYSKTLVLNVVQNSQDVAADNRIITRIPSDQGYDGTYGTTARDVDFELDAGLALKMDSGVATVKIIGYTQYAFYYEVLVQTEAGTKYALKCWAYDVEFGKPNESHATDTTQVSIGEYVYPVRLLGTPAIKATGTGEYVDENGIGRTVLILRSIPGDTDYETFGDAVPTPKVSADGGT